MINKQSNVYTIVYITVMVVIVGAALAFTAMSLKDRQLENADADKMKQILQSVHITTERATVVDEFHRYITSSMVVNDKGATIDGVDAFSVNVAQEAKKNDADRLLPVYVCTLDDGEQKHIIPLAGMGLWGAYMGLCGSRRRWHDSLWGIFRPSGRNARSWRGNHKTSVH